MQILLYGTWVPLRRLRLHHPVAQKSSGVVTTKFEQRATTGDPVVISNHPNKVFAITKIEGNEFHLIQTN
jgi:hypothetical protein